MTAEPRVFESVDDALADMLARVSRLREQTCNTDALCELDMLDRLIAAVRIAVQHGLLALA